MAANQKRGALMVCLGNICRSPIAEAVFAEAVKKRGQADAWFVDSAGTAGYHVGSKPDSRAIKTLEENSVPWNHRARLLCEEDFEKFDYIFGMDHSNIRDIEEEAPEGSKAKILMLGDFDPKKEGIIQDPYYSNKKAFEVCYERCVRCIDAFLDSLN